ncbi:MAG: MBL fold metallo-hydrolase, partial [Burkholderiales bacterium]
MKRLLLCLTAVLGFATAGSAAQAQLASRDLNYGEIVPIAPATRLVVGRSRDMRTNQSDVANVVMHKAGSTLVVIDNGATPGFRQYLDKAAAQLRPFDSVVLLITHGHSDHTGNNG